MNKEVVALAVVGVVALGTFIYYTFFDEKEKPMENRPSGRRQSRNQVPIVTQRKPCEVCDDTAVAKFLPCQHLVFCYEHANYYVNLSKKDEMKSKVVKCPECRVVVKKIV